MLLNKLLEGMIKKLSLRANNLDKEDYFDGYNENSRHAGIACKLALYNDKHAWQISVPSREDKRPSYFLRKEQMKFKELRLKEGISDILDALVGETDCSRLVRASMNEIIDRIDERLPLYREVLSQLKVVEDSESNGCDTLYVWFNEATFKFEIHYNSEFVVRSSLEDALLNTKEGTVESLRASFINQCAFEFCHELSHVLRNHMGRQSDLISGLDPLFVNIMGDCYINTELCDILAESGMSDKRMSIGISQDLCTTGILKINGKGIQEAILKFLKTGNAYLQNTNSLNHNFVFDEMQVGDEVELSVEFSSKFLKEIGANSNIFIKSFANLIDALFKKKSDTKSSTKDYNQDGTSQTQGGSNLDQDGTSQTQGGSNLDQIDSKELSDALGKIVESASEQVNQRTDVSEQAKINSKDALKATGSAISSKINANVSSWRSKLREILNRGMGCEEVYNPNLPSSRIEGELGRDEDVMTPKHIVIGMDCSGSMSFEIYKKCLVEIQNFCVASKLKRIKYTVFLWGSSAEFFVVRNTKALVPTIQARYSGKGGTDYFDYAGLLAKKCKQFDLLIDLTDGEFFFVSAVPQDIEAFMRKHRREHIWVLTPSHDKRFIQKLDPTCKSRTIVMKKD